jgi:hypothetical protein
MSEVYGPGHVYVPRAHDATSEWLPGDACALDGLTGGQLVIAGDMPVVCSNGFNTRAAVDLLALAGLKPARTRVHFRSGGAVAALDDATAADPTSKLVFQHAFPPEAAHSTRAWIDPSLLRYLNNKASLGDLIQPEHLPERRVVDRAHFFESEPEALPLVLKAVSDHSSAGGSGIMICRGEADLRSARHVFARCERIVAEALLDIIRNPCLHFAVMPQGDVRYLGFADQDISSAGKYVGNSVEVDSTLPQSVVDAAGEAVRRAATIGYYGFAGVDVALTRDERTYVLDLNFRLNASTASVLLASSISKQWGAAMMRLRKFGGQGSAEEMARRLAPFVTSGRLVPLSLFDAAEAGYAGKPPFVHALVIGDSWEAVRVTEAEVAAAVSA